MTDHELEALFQEESRRALLEARVPAAGQVWWRAAVRAHEEAARAATRPMVWLHGVAGACVAGLGVAAIGLAWPALEDAAARVGLMASSVEPGATRLALVFAAAMERSLTLALAVAACLVLTPIVVYLALSDE